MEFGFNKLGLWELQKKMRWVLILATV